MFSTQLSTLNCLSSNNNWVQCWWHLLAIKQWRMTVKSNLAWKSYVKCFDVIKVQYSMYSKILINWEWFHITDATWIHSGAYRRAVWTYRKQCLCPKGLLLQWGPPIIMCFRLSQANLKEFQWKCVSVWWWWWWLYWVGEWWKYTGAQNSCLWGKEWCEPLGQDVMRNNIIMLFKQEFEFA